MPAGLYFFLEYFPLRLPRISLKNSFITMQFIWFLWWHFNRTWLYFVCCCVWYLVMFICKGVPVHAMKAYVGYWMYNTSCH